MIITPPEKEAASYLRELWQSRARETQITSKLDEFDTDVVKPERKSLRMNIPDGYLKG